MTIVQQQQRYGRFSYRSVSRQTSILGVATVAALAEDEICERWTYQHLICYMLLAAACEDVQRLMLCRRGHRYGEAVRFEGRLFLQLRLQLMALRTK